MKYINSKIGTISAIGMGCMQTKNPEIISEACKKGINLFVTAEAYGDMNQKLAGDTLSQTDELPLILTKVGINFGGKNADEQFTQSREQIKESVLKCATLLRKTPLDLAGLHRLDDIHRFYTSEDRYVSAWEIALDELINLQEAGLIRHIGLSEPTADQLDLAVKITKTRGTSIAFIESAYSIVSRRAEVNGVKEVCDREDITFIAYSSVIRGLTDQRLKKIKPDDFELPDDQFQFKVFDLLGITGDFGRENVDMFSLQNIKNNVRRMLDFQDCATRYNVTPGQLSLAWIQHKGAIPIPGTNNLVHLVENIDSIEKVEALESAGVFAELDCLFPYGTFQGDPNPVSIAGALDANSEELNQVRDIDSGLSSSQPC